MKFTALLFLFITFQVQAKCKLILKNDGVWFNGCPRGSLAEAIDVRTQLNSPFTTVWVKCVKPEIVCEEDKNELQKL
jgi:hypothetical protein